eukprot:comp23075_c3_seq1/m.37006 comp23075_c3_seq1/g.37006  ORF comp23075_c3_seq1/g.37006 comp23075_c3_seq1/m.37006 type:complete len:389 (-) comp23075_c3_seq1:92-1258(-)
MSLSKLLFVVGAASASPLVLESSKHNTKTSSSTQNTVENAFKHSYHNEDRPLLTPELVNKIRERANRLWTPVQSDETNHRFYNWTVGQFRKTLNNPVPSNRNPIPEKIEEIFNAPNRKLRIKDFSNVDFSGLPKFFDSRQKWFDCLPVQDVPDQGNCGSCWAFGSSSAMSARVCIHSNGKIQERLSARDLMSCCEYCAGDQDGCSGAFPEDAYTFWKESGLVTGEGYGSQVGCQPYPIPINVGHEKVDVESPKCVRECTNDIGVRRNYTMDKIFASDVYRIPPLNVEAAMWDIYHHGPITVAYNVYEDFNAYKDGIYFRTTEDPNYDGHIVAVVGWGETDSGVKYWTVLNSWNHLWGHHGYFMIRRGTNECGIEELMLAGIPDVEPRM